DIDGREQGRFDRRAPALPQDAVLPEELDRLVGGAIDADLAVRHDAEAVLEADHGAAVCAEAVGEEAVAAGVAADRPRETVRGAATRPARTGGGGPRGSERARDRSIHDA